MENLFLLVLSFLAVESAGSIRMLYRHFLSGMIRLCMTFRLPEQENGEGLQSMEGNSRPWKISAFPEKKIGDYHTGTRRVLTNIFGSRYVHAYVTAASRDAGTRRLFFSTVSPGNLRMSAAWYEKSPINQTGWKDLPYVPLFLYSFRWNIEVSYYEQKTFWSLCAYMVRSRKGIECMVSLVNIAYCAMKILPYKDESFSEYRGTSVQEFRMELSRQINQQVIFASFVKNVEATIKSNVVIRALKSVLSSFGFHG